MFEDISELISLRSLIFPCSNCKKIRDDENDWKSPERYMSEHFNLPFTHGICFDCRKTLYPDL